MKKILVSWAVGAVALYLVSLLLGPSMEFDGIAPVLWTALLIGLLNALAEPVIRLLTCPFYLLTLGLFRFVVDAAFLLIARTVVHGFWIEGFWWALLAAVLVSLATTILNGIFFRSEES